jgi:cytochrome c biogenesis protein CcdA
MDINQRAFDTSVAGGETALRGWTGLISYGAGVLIVLLVAVGLWPRPADSAEPRRRYSST